MRRGSGGARALGVIAAGAVAVWLSLGTGVEEARGDVMPEEELWGRERGGGGAIAGVDRFAEHVFYVFPAYCTSALAALDGESLYFYDQDEFAGRPNYLVLRDGPLASWIGGNQACQASAIYALARDVAATIDLDAMPLEALRDFFEGDSRLFRAGRSFKFLDTPLYADKHSPLQQVDEVVRVLRIDAEDGIEVVVDAATYSFSDGTTQTLPLAHTRRPPLPFRPLKPAKVAKYVASHAKWLERLPGAPPAAPRLPALAAAGPGPGADGTGGAGTTEGTKGGSDAAGTGGSDAAGTTGGGTAGGEMTGGGMTGGGMTGSTGVLASAATGAVTEARAAGAIGPETGGAVVPRDDDPADMSTESGSGNGAWAVAAAAAVAAAVVGGVAARRRRRG